jgi:hypothetical protein
MEIYYVCLFVAQILSAFICAINIVPTNTGTSLLDRFVVTILWLLLALDNFTKL